MCQVNERGEQMVFSTAGKFMYAVPAKASGEGEVAYWVRREAASVAEGKRFPKTQATTRCSCNEVTG